MTTQPARILPDQLGRLVDMFIEQAHSDAAKYENRSPLDESDVFSLFALAAEIYAGGWQDGERAGANRTREGYRRRMSS